MCRVPLSCSCGANRKSSLVHSVRFLAFSVPPANPIPVGAPLPPPPPPTPTPPPPSPTHPSLLFSFFCHIHPQISIPAGALCSDLLENPIPWGSPFLRISLDNRSWRRVPRCSTVMDMVRGLERDRYRRFVSIFSFIFPPSPFLPPPSLSLFLKLFYKFCFLSFLLLLLILLFEKEKYI